MRDCHHTIGAIVRWIASINQRAALMNRSFAPMNRWPASIHQSETLINRSLAPNDRWPASIHQSKTLINRSSAPNDRWLAMINQSKVLINRSLPSVNRCRRSPIRSHSSNERSFEPHVRYATATPRRPGHSRSIASNHEGVRLNRNLNDRADPHS